MNSIIGIQASFQNWFRVAQLMGPLQGCNISGINGTWEYILSFTPISPRTSVNAIIIIAGHEMEIVMGL